MHARSRRNASMQMFLEELTYKIVAHSGVPSDRYHLGKIIQRSLMDDPNFILQIDASTDIRETGGSALRRSMQCAVAMKNYGLECGDVISLIVPNHIDVCIVYYAALYIGVALAPIDVNMGVKEMQDILDIQKPQMMFCINDYIKTVEKALTSAKLCSKIVTFDKSGTHIDFESFLHQFGDDTNVDEFKPTDFDSTLTISFLLMTSGTSGVLKCATLTHSSFIYGCLELWSQEIKFPDPERIALILSPLQWLSADIHYVLSPILRYTRLQSPLRLDRPHIYEMINKYRPTHMICSPTLMATLLNIDEVTNCNFSSFKLIILAGSFVSPLLFKTVKKIFPKCDIQVQYGQTESSGFVVANGDKPAGSVGKPLETIQFRLIDVNTQEDIVEANKAGELWLKGPAVFKGYYNDSEKTKEVFTDDGWLKTGDLLFMDENLNLYFVDRLKMLLKYKNHQVSPVEIENVIQQHPSVYDVAVTGVVEDLESGDLPVACVVRRPGHQVTAQEIKDLVKKSLSDTKQLRGGVIFMEQLPLTASSKINRSKLKKIVTELKREK